jgi:hypothetical protein
LSDFDNTSTFSTDFSREKKSQNIKFHENPSSGSRAVPCGQTDRGTEVTKLVVAFCSFANASKNADPAFLRETEHKHINHRITEKEAKGKGHPCTGTEALYRPYGL